MTDRVTDLYNANKIDRYEYDTYLLFGTSELGVKYLKNMLEFIALEPSPNLDIAHNFVWLDGRRSIWRDVKLIVAKVDQLIKGLEQDDSGRNLNPFHPYANSAAEPLRTFNAPANTR